MATKHEYYDNDDSGQANNYDPYWESQTWTVGSAGADENHDVTKIVVVILKAGSYSATSTWSITSVGGSNEPDESDVLASGTIAAGDLSTSATAEDITMSSYELQASTQYGLIQDPGGGSAGNHLSWRWDAVGASYGGGVRWYSDDDGATWNIQTQDYMFEIWGDAVGGAPAWSVNVDDAWKAAAAVTINVDDSWKAVAAVTTNVDDAWKAS